MKITKNNADGISYKSKTAYTYHFKYNMDTYFIEKTDIQIYLISIGFKC